MKLIKILFLIVLFPNISLGFDTVSIPSISAGLSVSASNMRLRAYSPEDRKTSSNGYYFYNKKGEYKGIISKNQKCIFYNSYSNSNAIQITYTQINRVQLYCK